MSINRHLTGNTPFTLTQVIYPSNAVNKAVTWSSSNESVATVSATGVVTPIAEGMTLIVVTTVDRGNMDGCVVNVTKQDIERNKINPKERNFKNQEHIDTKTRYTS